MFLSSSGWCPWWYFENPAQQDADCAGCFGSFCSFIPWSLLRPFGRNRCFEQGSRCGSLLHQFSCVSFKLHRLIIKVKGMCGPMHGVLLRTATGWMHALLRWSTAKVISDGLSGYLYKPLWSEAGGKEQTEISTHRNYILLIFARCLASSSRSEKGRWWCLLGLWGTFCVGSSGVLPSHLLMYFWPCSTLMLLLPNPP